MEKMGFIVDSPKVLIKSKKGLVVIDRASSGECNFSGDSISISGGWSAYALAEIPKSTKIEVKITNPVFDMNQMALQSGGTIKEGAVNYTKFGDIYTVVTGNTIVINEAAIAKSILIDGMTEVTTEPLATKQFKVVIAANTTTISFFTDVLVGTEISPVYEILTDATAVNLSAKTTDFPSSGSVVMTFPIFESETTESAVFAYGQLTIYKAMISQTSKLGASYKTASSFDISLTGLDARRADSKCWDFTIIPKIETV